jgi:Domain of unknown function (DUF6265)
MNSRSWFAFVVTALLLTASVSLSHAAECSLTGLAWMAGNWHNTTDPQRAQERWVIAPDSILMGSSWEIPKGKMGFAEVMTVRPNANAISMYLRHFDGALSGAWEERNAPMVFTAVNCMHPQRCLTAKAIMPASTSPISAPATAFSSSGTFCTTARRAAWSGA